MYREFLSGPAGSGKTYEVRRRIAEDPSYGVLASTTGISAINLGDGVTTINSLLGYYDTDSLSDRHLSGRLQSRLRQIAKEYRNIVIDEISMMDSDQLDIIHQAIDVMNDLATTQRPLGLVLTGDFAQLPPVKAKWAFEADVWPLFAEKTTRLTKIWRQDNPRFLEAINLTRCGEGKAAAEILSEIVGFHSSLDSNFDGSTVVGTNAQVDRQNWSALRKLTGRKITLASRRTGEPNKSLWKQIPEKLELKTAALVMLLANDWKQGYVNGDLGYIGDHEDGEIVAYSSPQSKEKEILVKLIRNDKVVSVSSITRYTEKRDRPRDTTVNGYDAEYAPERNRWLTGEIIYYPVRLAYATTVHKTQSLTLDRVQIDLRHAFMGANHMLYVAVSRCRTPEGLRLVGSPEVFEKRVRVCPEVKEWL